MVIFEEHKFRGKQVWKDFRGLFFADLQVEFIVSLRHYFFEDEYFVVNN